MKKSSGVVCVFYCPGSHKNEWFWLNHQLHQWSSLNHRMTTVRFQGKKFHLTYKTHVEFEGLLRFLRDISEVSYYSLVHEEGTQEDPYAHTHALVDFRRKISSRNARLFDFNSIHPNIKAVQSDTHWDRTWEYHKKAPIRLEQSTKRLSDVKRIKRCVSLAEAVEELGIPIRTVNDVKLIRDESEIPVHRTKYPDYNWRIPVLTDFKVLLITGPSQYGKTQWALAHFKSPLMVCHMDELRKFRPDIHDGIVFDDMDFKHIPRTSAIHLLDWDMERTVYCRYCNAVIPAETRKIFTSNERYIFPEDEHGAINNRITNEIRIASSLI